METLESDRAAPSRSCWTRVRQSVVLYGNLALLVLLFALDVRDLHFKMAWVGPFDTFAFAAVGHTTFERAPLVVAEPALRNRSRASGWASFLSRCATLQGAEGFFLHAIATNCTLGPTGLSADLVAVSPHVLLAGSMRVDTVAWASCRLLFANHRPPLCFSPMVMNFVDRYRITYPDVPSMSMVKPGSIAEEELLEMLLLLSMSAPSYRITCVEGVEFESPGTFEAGVYGCGSPNTGASAFVGVHATAIRDLLRPLAWLTLDTIQVFGVAFSLRQNDRSTFTISQDVTTGEIAVAHATEINFSSSGALYDTMVALDIMLLLLHLYSGLEIAQAVLLPLLRDGVNMNEITEFVQDEYTTMFSRSLYRSRPVAVVTVISQLLAWQLMLANSIVWTWTEDLPGRTQAYLTSLRFWVLLLLSFNTFWDVVVFVHEKAAFYVTQHTFVSTLELMAVGALVVVIDSAQLFSVGGTKYDLEHQRMLDTMTFVGHQAFGNAYDEVVDYQTVTPSDIVQIVYAPLVHVIGVSILALCVLLATKAIVYHLLRPSPRRLTSLRAGIPYARVPIEKMLNTPMRAKSLVRNTFSCELVLNGDVFVRAPTYFDLGIIARQGRLCTRRGFVNVIPFSVDLDAPSKTATATEPTVPALPTTAVAPTPTPAPPKATITARRPTSPRKDPKKRTFEGVQHGHTLNTPLR